MRWYTRQKRLMSSLIRISQIVQHFLGLCESRIAVALFVVSNGRSRQHQPRLDHFELVNAQQSTLY